MNRFLYLDLPLVKLRVIGETACSNQPLTYLIKKVVPYKGTTRIFRKAMNQIHRFQSSSTIGQLNKDRLCYIYYDLGMTVALMVPHDVVQRFKFLWKNMLERHDYDFHYRLKAWHPIVLS